MWLAQVSGAHSRKFLTLFWGLILSAPCFSFAQGPATQSLLSTTAPASAQAKPSRRSIFKYKFGVEGESFANEKDQSQAVLVKADADFKYRLVSSLEFHTHLVGQWVSGYSHSQFGEGVPSTGLFLREGLLQWSPFGQYFSVSAGAIDQKHQGSELFVSSRAFPGALEKIKTGNDAVSLELKAQQSIPTSSTLSTKAVNNEKPPSFHTQTATVKAKPGSSWQVEGFGTHFTFKDLPTVVAADSELHGNEIEGDGPNSKKFRFEFDGFVYGGKSKLRIMRGFSAEVFGHVIVNTKAPETYRNAQMIGGELEIGLPGATSLRPRFESFFVESDAVPAFYNSSDYGHNNRQGYSAGLDLEFRDAGFVIGGKYIDASLINPGTQQSRLQYILVRLVTLYDVL